MTSHRLESHVEPGSADCPTALEAAADQAPDAPAVSDAAWPARRTTHAVARCLEAGQVWAPSASRTEVLDVARRAIEENLARIGRSVDSHPRLKASVAGKCRVAASWWLLHPPT